MQKLVMRRQTLEEYDGPMLIDIHEASVLLGIKVSRLRTFVFKKEIPFRKVGGMIRFLPKELNEWINSDATRPNDASHNFGRRFG